MITYEDTETTETCAGGGWEGMTQVLRLHGREEDLESVADGHQTEARVAETDVLSFRTGLLGRRVTGLEATVSGMKNTYTTFRYRGRGLCMAGETATTCEGYRLFTAEGNKGNFCKFIDNSEMQRWLSV